MPYNGGIVSTDERLRDALECALADARARLEPELRTLTHELSDAAAARLASAAEALDRADSLAEVLRTLVGAAAQYADRIGLFLVRDGRVRPWHLHGVAEEALSTADADGVATFPITVGNRVVAILYTDAPHVRAGSLDVLTRYTGRLLEAKTLHMALGIAAR